MNAAIFKAYDIRGEVGPDLNTSVCLDIGRALADWLPERGTVAVGYDMRPDSKQLAEAVIEGLCLQGREVLNIGLVSSDMIYFTVGSLGLAGGAMITASHNPGSYNGIKVCREDAKPIGIDTGLLAVRDAAMAGSFAAVEHRGAVTERDVREGWIKHVLSFVDVAKWPSYHIAIDAGNGMLGAIAPVLEPHTPLQIERMYFELDGTFPNHIANPIEPQNLVDLQAKVRSEKLDFGIAFDGDGDRSVLIDETGEPVSGTVMTAILARYFLSRSPGATILYNAICGRIVPETVAKYGGKSIRTKVGHSYIKADMRANDAVFAGEHSGHYFFRDNWSADSGLLAATIAVQVLAESGDSLSELVAEYQRYVSISETNFEVDDKPAVIKRLKATFTDGVQDELDGLTVNYENSWFNVRPSNTEPVLRLNAEARTQDELDVLVAKVQLAIKG